MNQYNNAVNDKSILYKYKNADIHWYAVDKTLTSMKKLN